MNEKDLLFSFYIYVLSCKEVGQEGRSGQTLQHRVTPAGNAVIW